MREQERIGEFLMRIGVLSDPEIRRILAEQEDGGKELFGRIALRLGLVDDRALHRYAVEHGSREEPISSG